MQRERMGKDESQRPWRTMATASHPAPNVPFYTPQQSPPAGTALDLSSPDKSKREAVPTLFTPLRIRGVTLHHRIAVSPMCQYSADLGHLTDWHLVHLGQFAIHGAALVMVEATAVAANGRISPEDSGLWQDSQVAPLRRAVDFVHSQGSKVGIQLAHAGRKASTLSMWNGPAAGSQVAEKDVGGWPEDVWAPSPIAYHETYPRPNELSVEAIQGLVREFGAAARRAMAAGVDLIELHAAHGYLLSEFLSPIANQRTDEYGGSFENRIRFLVEVIREVRQTIPEDMPLFVRVSGTEWMEWSGKPSWDVSSTVALAKLLPDLGVDLIDVSSGGVSYEQKITVHPYYQVNIAGTVREALQQEGKGMLVGAVGMITNAEMARSITAHGEQPSAGKSGQTEKVPEGEKGEADGTIEVHEENVKGHKTTTQADLVFLARQFLREPEFVLRTAANLGVRVAWPNQYNRAQWSEHVRP